METDKATPAMRNIVSETAPLESIWHGGIFTEGPVWHSEKGYFLWTDIVGDKILKWTPGVGASVYMEPTGKADGLALDLEGRVLVAGWGARTVWREELDGSTVVLASHWQGKKLNTPNDIIVKSDGAIYFTDPIGGMTNPGMCHEDVQQYLDVLGTYRIAPDGGGMTLVADDVVYPNGLCFSPDESLLYINDTRGRTIWVYDVQPDGSLTNGRKFYEDIFNDEPGVPDGMKCDVEGNVYCTASGGIHVIDPQGNLIGRLRTPEHVANFGFGDADWKTMYICQMGNVWRVRMNIPGVPQGPAMKGV
jgi:gluconolactonase